MPLELPAIFAAGLLTFLSPCVLPLVPIYVGLLAGASAAEVRAGRRSGRLLATAAAFALGLGAVFVVLGLAATSAARLVSEHRAFLLQVGGVAIAAMGLRQLGLLRIPALDRERRPLLGRVRGGGSLLGALAFGAAFGLGWTPCVGPVLGAVLTYAAGGGSPARGALLLGTYAAGLATPLLAVAAAAPRALALLDRVKPHLRAVERATGALLVAAGALLAADRLSWLMPSAGPGAASGPAPAAAAAPAPAPAPLSADSAQGATCATPSSGLAPTAADGAACATPALPFPPSAGAPTDGLEAALVAAAAPRPSVVEVVSASCPVCERMAPVVAEAKRRCAGRHLAIETRRVESAEGAALARRHAVRGVPTFLLLDASGGEVGRLVGEQPLAALERAMLDLTGGRCGS